MKCDYCGREFTRGEHEGARRYCTDLDCERMRTAEYNRAYARDYRRRKREDDGQWTSNIEQTSDKIFSLVRPRKYKKEGEMFGSKEVHGNDQMVISVLKQKLGPANFARWVKFDPIYNKLEELEVKKQGVNNG